MVKLAVRASTAIVPPATAAIIIMASSSSEDEPEDASGGTYTVEVDAVGTVVGAVVVVEMDSQ